MFREFKVTPQRHVDRKNKVGKCHPSINDIRGLFLNKLCTSQFPTFREEDFLINFFSDLWPIFVEIKTTYFLNHPRRFNKEDSIDREYRIVSFVNNRGDYLPPRWFTKDVIFLWYWKFNQVAGAQKRVSKLKALFPSFGKRGSGNLPWNWAHVTNPRQSVLIPWSPVDSCEITYINK